MAKHLSEDEVTLTVNARAEKAQQNIHTFSKEIDRLGERNKSLQRQMEALELAGKKNTDSWRQRRAEYGRNASQIRSLKQHIADETKALDLNALTMSQLRQQARNLQRQLDNTSRSLNPDEWAKLSSRLSDVRTRMRDLTEASTSLVEKYSSPQTMSFFRGEMFVRFAELAGKALQKVKEFAAEGISMAESADGVIHAFSKLDRPELLDNLRKATRGTVSDIELMKAAVKARDFRIPLEDLGKYLSFAQLKAQQLDVSVQQMTDDIVTGLGRQSPQILDNLGLSATEISEKTKETGSFMKSVASIVENELAEAGETYISAADRAAQKTTSLQNRQLELGKALLPLKEKVADAFGSMKIGIMQCIVWLITHRKATAALTVAVTALTVSMTVLNAAFRAWVAQTTIAKVVTTAWASTVTTLKGVYLLLAAAINVMRGNTLRATAQMRLFNIACKSNVILLLVTALVAAGAAFIAWSSKTEKARAAMVSFNIAHARVAADIRKQSNEIEKTVNENTAAEITKVKTLRKTILDTSKSYNQRKKAIQDMQAIVPGYHASITKEGRLFKDNSAAIDNYIRNLRRAARAEAAYEQMKANEREILNAQDTVDDARAKKKSVTGAASGRGLNLNKGERVEARTTTYMAGENAETKVYHVVVDKAGKVIREIDEATATALRNDQNWDKMFSARLKTAQDKINQYTQQNDRLQKIIEQNGGTGQKIEHGTVTPDKKTPRHTTDPAFKQFSQNRTADLEAEKQAYNNSLATLQKALAEKRLTQEQYNASVSALNIQHNNQLLNIEKAYLQQAHSLTTKDAARKHDLIFSQQQAVAAQQQQANNAYLEAEKQYYEALDRIRQAAPSQPQTLRQECEEKLLILDGYYKASLQLAKDDASRQKQVTAAFEAARAAIKAEYAHKEQEQKAQALQQHGLYTFDDELAARRKKINDDFEKGLLDQEQHNQALDNLDQQAEEHRLQIRQQYGLASQQELYNAELAQLKQHLQNKEISETEYEEAVKNMRIARMKEVYDYYSNLSSGAVQALMQAEEASVDARYDAEIEAARKAGNDTTELENKKAGEKLKIQKKYADVNFAIKASQIIADTATSIMKAYADLGPIAGTVAAALMGITGAAQLSAANAERQKVKRMSLNGAAGAAAASGTRVATGRQSGGSIDVEREQDGRRFHAAWEPDRRGFVGKPTVIVGEGGYGHSREWVASNAAVENPTVAPVIDIIDRAQRAGTIRTLDMNKLLLQQAAGRAEGGPVNPAMPSASPSQPLTPGSSASTLIERLTAVLNRLASEGIPAAVALDDIDRMQQLRNRARQFGSK